MSVSLSKGQTVSLAKNVGLTRVFMGLGWDAVKPKGFFARMTGGGGEIDLDASVIAFDQNKQAVDTVWFRQLTGLSGAIVHSGDNRTGEGDGDDEVINVDLSKLPPQVMTMVFTVNSFTGQNFNQVENATCRLVDATTGTELVNFKLTEKGAHTGVIMSVLTRKSGEWEMKAIGEADSGRTVQDLASNAVNYI
jgi:tellurium resistance protein TerZ